MLPNCVGSLRSWRHLIRSLGCPASLVAWLRNGLSYVIDFHLRHTLPQVRFVVVATISKFLHIANLDALLRHAGLQSLKQLEASTFI